MVFKTTSNVKGHFKSGFAPLHCSLVTSLLVLHLISVYLTVIVLTIQLKQVEEYMRYRKLPSPLKLKVHDYYYQRYRGHLFDEEQILKELSHALKEV